MKDAAVDKIYKMLPHRFMPLLLALLRGSAASAAVSIIGDKLALADDSFETFRIWGQQVQTRKDTRSLIQSMRQWPKLRCTAVAA